MCQCNVNVFSGVALYNNDTQTITQTQCSMYYLIQAWFSNDKAFWESEGRFWGMGRQVMNDIGFPLFLACNIHLPLRMNGGEHKDCQNNIQALRRKWEGRHLLTEIMDKGMTYRGVVVWMSLCEAKHVTTQCSYTIIQHLKSQIYVYI